MGNVDKSYLTTVSKKSNVLDGCHKPERCSIDCPSGSSTCEAGWEESQCLCNEGKNHLLQVYQFIAFSEAKL